MKVAISFVSLIEALRVGWDLVCFVCVYVCGRMEMGGNCSTETFRKFCLQGANLPIYFQRISSVKELFKGKGVEKVNDTPYYFILIVHVG